MITSQGLLNTDHIPGSVNTDHIAGSVNTDYIPGPINTDHMLWVCEHWSHARGLWTLLTY